MNLLRLKFSVAFQRLEYALKEAGYHRPKSDQNDAAEVDWPRFKKAANASGATASLPELHQLLMDPPMKQYSRDGALPWDAAELGGGGSTFEAIEAIKRMRNNLFHGGKGNEAAHAQERSDKLLQLGLAVIEKLITIDPKVEHAFWDTFDSHFEKSVFQIAPQLDEGIN
ncbi:hypothetical protein [Kordiimonas sp.]|uniref:hypothetical protein n=1 Tax=Kordiimonas sp. TaxID=1970157 RepID=UPI003A95863B